MLRTGDLPFKEPSSGASCKDTDAAAAAQSCVWQSCKTQSTIRRGTPLRKGDTESWRVLVPTSIHRRQNIRASNPGLTLTTNSSRLILALPAGPLVGSAILVGHPPPFLAGSVSTRYRRRPPPSPPPADASDHSNRLLRLESSHPSSAIFPPDFFTTVHDLEHDPIDSALHIVCPVLAIVLSFHPKLQLPPQPLDHIHLYLNRRPP